MSIIWANDPALTFRRLVIFVFSCLGVLAVVRHFRFEDLIRFTFLSTSIYLLIGVAVEICVRQVSPFYGHVSVCWDFPSQLPGANCTLLLLTAIYLAKVVKRGTLFYHAVSSDWLYLSGPHQIQDFPRLRHMRTTRVLVLGLVCIPKMAAGFGAGWCGTLILFFFSDTIISHNWKLASLGREGADIKTFTGRIPLWEECLKYFYKQPFLGYGYQAFWSHKHVDAISLPHRLVAVC